MVGAMGLRVLEALPHHRFRVHLYIPPYNHFDPFGQGWSVLRNGLVLVRRQAEGIPKSNGVLHAQLLAPES